MTDRATTKERERAEERLFPSIWAERHRIIGGKPWTLDGREYLRDIMDDMSREVCVRKAAQLGLTEVAQNLLAHAVDFGVDAMLVMPTEDTAKRHSKARFKALCEESEYISGIFLEVDSVDVKRSIDTALYIEGSNSGDALYSVPVGLLVIDENDRCNQDALEAADHRLDGHMNPRRWDISTPTIPEHGIDKRWGLSDQKRWLVECPAGCGWSGPLEGGNDLREWELLTWEGHPAVPDTESSWAIARTAKLVCPSCKHRWDDLERRTSVSTGRWVPSFPDRRVSGYALNQLLSPTTTVPELVYRYFVAYNDPNPERLRQYVNQVLGLPFLGEGEEVTAEQVQGLTVPATASGGRLRCLGADIGKVIHVALGGMAENHLCVERCFTVDGWTQLDNVMRVEGILSAVVDQNPERRNSEEFCARHPGVAYRAYHPEGMSETYRWDHKRRLVQIKHVDAVDLLLGRIRRETMRIVRAGDWEEMCRHLTHVNVVMSPNPRSKVPERRVVKTGADHYGFASIYLEAAASRVIYDSGEWKWETDPALKQGVTRDYVAAVPQEIDLWGSHWGDGLGDIYGNNVERWEKF